MLGMSNIRKDGGLLLQGFPLLLLLWVRGARGQPTQTIQHGQCSYQSDVRALQEAMSLLQGQFTTVLEENRELSTQVSAIKAQQQSPTASESPQTDSDNSDLQEAVSLLQRQVTTLLEENRELRTRVSDITTAYVRWGRTVCPANAATIYSGTAAGSYYEHTGGPSDYICLPNNPQWGRYQDGTMEDSYIYGGEFQIGGNSPFLLTNAGVSNLDQHDVPCTLCHVTGSTAVLMVPAMTQCPSGWSLQYKGYLMAERNNHRGRAGPVCVDEAPEVVAGGGANTNGVLFYMVEAICGALQCPNYVNGRELACVVCTK